MLAANEYVIVKRDTCPNAQVLDIGVFDAVAQEAMRDTSTWVLVRTDEDFQRLSADETDPNTEAGETVHHDVVSPYLPCLVRRGEIDRENRGEPLTEVVFETVRLSHSDDVMTRAILSEGILVWETDVRRAIERWDG